MLNRIVDVYCVCDEVLKAFNIKDDSQCKMTSAEVMTFALMSAMIFRCDYKMTRLVSLTCRLFPKILSHSQLVRRIHQIPDYVWYLVFQALQILLRNKENQCFIVDSFPIKAYENHKSFRARIFRGKEFHGYCASKKVYFFGLKVHMIIDSDGIPVEFSFTPGSYSDIESLRDLPLHLPKDSVLLGDKAYTDYGYEDSLRVFQGIRLLPKRKNCHKRQHSPENNKLLSTTRNYIESVFSSIVGRMPRWIRARTERGFCIKIFLFILSYMFNLLS